MALSNQTVGNVGLYYLCYRLSLLGWNVMPTARNARGIDILAYSQDAKRIVTVQVKALSKRAAVGLSNNLDHLLADFVVICRYVARENPECFILTSTETKQLAQRKVKRKKVSYWLQYKDYESEQFRSQWNRIGVGQSVVPASSTSNAQATE